MKIICIWLEYLISFNRLQKYVRNYTENVSINLQYAQFPYISK